MKPIKLTIIFSMFLAIVSCSNEFEYKSKEILESKPHQLELNLDEKWIVDKEMMIAIKKIESDIKNFNGSTVESHNKLGKAVHLNLKQLTSSCTMTGQSHEELHKWLLPFFDLNDELEKATTIEGAITNLEDMNYELIVFTTYFK